MIQRLVLFIGVTFCLSLAAAGNDFHSLIESSSHEGEEIQRGLVRAVSSENTFKADIVSVKRERAYNPVTFNPLAESDGDVEVIVKSREP
ncbi:hypothetical protein ACLVWU_08845 [Bdellovibrio sp. HCB290]|uniref:hypothetical protein n=1 Tax=Bdellovibrio sp. HCB290 TaxID=3394356 RepID=UPI0039B649EA